MNTPGTLASAAQERVNALVATFPFYRQGLLEIAALLPQSDDALHEWLGESVARRDGLQFVFTICAAALAGRKLRAGLLPGGVMLMPDIHRFAWIAWRMEGDVAGNLAAAVEAKGLSRELEAMALFVAVAWCQKHRDGEIPRPILAAARSLARGSATFNEDARATVGALQALTGNAGLLSLGVLGRFPRLRALAEKLKNEFLAIMEKPFEDLVPEKEVHEYRLGTPMRRAVERIGRNEPCPCKSGRKYKRCCEAKDQARLKLSTGVAGKTFAELQYDPEEGMTLMRLQKALPPELARLDPLKLPPELREEYLLRLAIFGFFDELAAAFEKLGVTEELEPAWKRLFLFVIKAWRRESAERLVRAHPRGEAVLPETESGVRLLLASADPASFLQALEKEALAVLESGDQEETQSLALALLASPYRALGIFFARSLLPLEGMEVSFLFDEILQARDKLGLPPDDELGDFVDEQMAGEHQENDSPALREAREKVDRKAAEVRRVREELAAARRQIALREKRERRATLSAAAAGQAPKPEDESLKKMRAREKELEALLKERGTERVAYRREVEKLRHEVATLQAVRAEETCAAEVEEPGEAFKVSGNQPVRLIHFPKGFRETLDGFPKHVGRGAINRLGRMAAGEPEAFDRVKQLKAYPDVLRARVADKYRLLFCLEPDGLRVVDLIRRADLDRRIERLKAGGLPAIA